MPNLFLSGSLVGSCVAANLCGTGYYGSFYLIFVKLFVKIIIN